MKRPEGFDKPAPQGASRGKPSQKKIPASKASANKAALNKASTNKAAANRAPAKQAPKQVQKKRLHQSSPHQSSSRQPAPRKAEPAARRKVRAAARNRRRFERSEIRRFTRRSRNRRLGWLVGTGVIVGLIGLLAVAVYSPILALRTITVDGTSAVDATAVHTALDGQLGTPLALVNYDQIREDLDAFPLIRSYVTEVVPPNTLRVHIVERTPVGAIATPTAFSLVDPAGVVLGTSDTRPKGVPLITVGADGTNGVSFHAVVAVMLSLPSSLRSQVDTASASSNDDVTLVLSGAHQRVVWGNAERSALKARVLTELVASRGGAADVEYDVSAPLSPVVRGG